MSQLASIEWWNQALTEVGIQSMDKEVGTGDTWHRLLRSGQRDLELAQSITGMQTGKDRSVLEVGCGLGRMSAALADRFGYVLGIDIAPTLIERAREQNLRPNVHFELGDGVHLCPTSRTAFDSVFSYEVFYYLTADSLKTYIADLSRLVKPGGQFVFQMNLVPIRWTTRVAMFARRVLYACGIKQWRGWSTGAGLRRYYHSERWLRATLSQHGFHVNSISGPSLQQTWIVATRTAPSK